jgi:AcrR family transcriptional regulator
MTQERTIVKGEGGQTRRTQSERRAQTRAALIAAGRTLFTERGFAGAGREDIVEHAGLTRGALYHHFASKDDLFAAVYEEVERDLCAAVIVAAAVSDDPVEELRLGAFAFLDACANPDVRRIVLLDGPAVLAPEVRHEIGQRYGLGLVREVLRAADAARRHAHRRRRLGERNNGLVIEVMPGSNRRHNSGTEASGAASEG